MDLLHERAQVRVFPFLNAAMRDAKHRERIDGAISPSADSSRARAGKLAGDGRIEIEEALLGGRYGRPDCGLVDRHRRPLSRFWVRWHRRQRAGLARSEPGLDVASPTLGRAESAG